MRVNDAELSLFEIKKQGVRQLSSDQTLPCGVNLAIAGGYPPLKQHIIFGGSCYKQGRSNETWISDGVQFYPLIGRYVPPINTTEAYTSQLDGQLYLVDTLRAESWRYADTRWVLHSTIQSADSRNALDSRSVNCAVSPRGLYILDQEGTLWFSDAEGTITKEAESSDGPGGYASGTTVFVWDSQNSRLLFQTGAFRSELWSFENRAWQKLTPRSSMSRSYSAITSVYSKEGIWALNHELQELWLFSDNCWQLQWHQVWEPNQPRYHSICFSESKNTLFACCDSGIVLFDNGIWKPVFSFPSENPMKGNYQSSTDLLGIDSLSNTLMLISETALFEISTADLPVMERVRTAQYDAESFALRGPAACNADLISELHMECFADYILPHVLPAAAVKRKAVETELTVPVSKLGGNPHLRSDTDWPENLPFLCQIVLEDLASIGFSTGLPETGMLSFFYNQEYDTGSVLYFENCVELKLCSNEETSEIENFTRCSLSFESFESLPDSFDRSQIDNEEYLRILLNSALPDDFYESLISSSRTLTYGQNEPHHQMFGHAKCVQSDTIEYCIRNAEARFGELSDEYKDPSKWRMLLQLDSDSLWNSCWGDCGMINFYIHTDDLARKAFDKAVTVFQCY